MYLTLITSFHGFTKDIYETYGDFVKRSTMENKFLLLTERNKKEVLDYMPSDNSINKLALFFQNFSDGTRLKIISCLAMCDMCVNDLSNILQINQTTISHQLKYLKTQHIVTSTRDGKIILYSLASRKVNELMLTAVNAV
jgi:ArsR family transcriptional regulator